MTDGVVWTREQQENTLAGLSLMREAQAGGELYAATDVMREVAEIAQQWGEPVPDVLARLVAGLVNGAGLLLDWIENEATHRGKLIERIEQQYPAFEIGYHPDPSWATWSGVLHATKETVRTMRIID
jgi:hypothetical protein